MNYYFEPVYNSEAKLYYIKYIVEKDGNRYVYIPYDLGFKNEKTVLASIKVNMSYLLQKSAELYREKGELFTLEEAPTIDVSGEEVSPKNNLGSGEKREKIIMDHKIKLSDPDENVKYYWFKGEDNKYYIKVIYLDVEEVLEGLAFNTSKEAIGYIELKHKDIENSIYRNLKKFEQEGKKEKTTITNTSTEGIWEVKIPSQKDNIKYYVVKSIDEYADLYYIRVYLSDLKKEINFPRLYLSKENAKKYIERKYAKLEERAYKRVNKETSRAKSSKENNEVQTRSENTNSENRGIVGKLCIYGAGLLTAAVLIGSCHSCAKGCGSATCNPTVTVKMTNSPEPKKTPEPTEVITVTESAVTIDEKYINTMSEEVLEGYMSANSSFGSINNGGVNGSTITASDIKNAIAILNIDELSINNYDTFRSIVSDKQPDAFLNEADIVMQNIMANNMQIYASKKYNPNSNKRLKGLLWLSPLLIDETDRADMEFVEGLIERIIQADLDGDVNTAFKLTEELCKILNSQFMKNRGNGFARALYHELEFVLSCAGNSMSEDVYNNIASIKENMRESTYVAIMNILTSLKDYGCGLLYIENSDGNVVEAMVVRTKRKSLNG